MGAVQTLRVSWEVREQIGAPPQKDGQLIIGARVSVSRAVVRAHTGKLHVSEGTLGLENPTVPVSTGPWPQQHTGTTTISHRQSAIVNLRKRDTALKHSYALKGIVSPQNENSVINYSPS